jgi:opacity protein-like surface antigen
LTEGDLDLRGKTTTVSAMLNGLIDVGVTDGLALYGGGGYGRSWVRSVGDEDSSWAWQWIVGVRFAVSEDVEIGLKQRYFNSGIVRLRHRPPTHAGNAAIMPEIEGEHRIRSMLLSLHFKL